MAICLYILKSIKKHSKEEIYCQLPSDTEIEDFGPVPRSRYPLVALLTLADEDDREIYDIVSIEASGIPYLYKTGDSKLFLK